jgi:hypothetical protein
MNLEKFIIMKILQSKGIYDWNDSNYNDILHYTTKIIIEKDQYIEMIIVIKPNTINLNNSEIYQYTESITLDQYKSFKRNLIIDSITK